MDLEVGIRATAMEPSATWQDERRELMIKLRAKENQVLHAEQEIQAKHEEIQGCEPRMAAQIVACLFVPLRCLLSPARTCPDG